MKKASLLTLLVVITLTAMLLSLCMGNIHYSPSRLFVSLYSGSGIDFLIITQTRIPRMLLCLITGAALAVSGCMFQALLKNPLAEPYTTGVSSGAALGATIAIVFSMGFFLTTVFALIGSLIVISIVFFISRKVSFIMSSSVLLIYSFSNTHAMHKAIMWLMGDLALAHYRSIFVMGILTALLTAVSLIFSKQLDIISFGEEISRNLGISRFETGLLFWVSALLAALCVSLCGVIGFIGLIIPHVMRFFIGPSHRMLLPSSALGGAILLLVSDTLGRTLIPPYEIPVGVITGFFGGIFFLVLVVKK